MDGLVQNGKLVIDNMEYDKIVITPLVMDFGTKTTYYDKAHYNNKPVKTSCRAKIDLFNGIRNYKTISLSAV